jgi:hypothetical protein
VACDCEPPPAAAAVCTDCLQCDKATSSKGLYMVLYLKFRGQRAPLSLQQHTVKRPVKIAYVAGHSKLRGCTGVRYSLAPALFCAATDEWKALVGAVHGLVNEKLCIK